MVKKYSTHSWIGSFAGRLMQLQPDMSIASAVRCAVESIHHSTALDPQQAAEAFASKSFSEQRLDEPEPARPSMSDHSARYRALFGAAMPSLQPAGVSSGSHAP